MKKMQPNNGSYALLCTSRTRNGRMLVADVTGLGVVVGPLLQQRRLGGTNTVIGMLALVCCAPCRLSSLWRPVRCPLAQPTSLAVFSQQPLARIKGSNVPVGWQATLAASTASTCASSLQSRDHEVAQLPAVSEAPLLPKARVPRSCNGRRRNAMRFWNEHPVLMFALFSLYVAASHFLVYHTVACVASDITAEESNASGSCTASSGMGTHCCLLGMG